MESYFCSFKNDSSNHTIIIKIIKLFVMKDTHKNWLKVWNDRSMDMNPSKTLLENLIIANGFDHGEVDYEEDEWRRMCLHFGELIGIDESYKILEIGSGAGAFLLPLQENFSCKIYGIDYSEPLIRLAREKLNGNFYIGEASQLNIIKEKFNLILAHSVVHYFPTHNYTNEVINQAYSLLYDGGKIGLLDINDASKEDIYHASRKVKHTKTKDYDSRFSNNHPHLFFTKEEIADSLSNAGFDNINFYKNIIESYGNSNFRFNVIAEKIPSIYFSIFLN